MTMTSPNEFATLHFECLPSSMPARLGLAYLQSLYRYVVRSPWEIVETVRREDQLVGAAVTTLRPLSLVRRLFLQTSLVRHGVALTPGVVRCVLAGSLAGKKSPRVSVRDVPELVWIYVCPELRNQAIGSYLITETEAELVSRGVQRYAVRTAPEADDPAQAFYRRHGFRAEGGLRTFGNEFQWLVKKL